MSSSSLLVGHRSSLARNTNKGEQYGHMIDIDQSIKINLVKDILTDDDLQRLTILPNDELRIVITIPHDVFEWFIDVFDGQDNKVHSNWIDHYGDTDSNLNLEMKESVENFIQSVTRYPLRVFSQGSPERSTLEVYKDEMWTTDIY